MLEFLKVIGKILLSIVVLAFYCLLGLVISYLILKALPGLVWALTTFGLMVGTVALIPKDKI